MEYIIKHGRASTLTVFSFWSRIILGKGSQTKRMISKKLKMPLILVLVLVLR